MIDLIISSVFVFLIGIFVVRKAIVFLKNVGFVGKDVHKEDMPLVAEMGGLPVVIAFIAGILFFIGFNTATSKTVDLPVLFASLLTIIIIMLVGMLDDMTSLMKKKGKNSDVMKNHKRIGFKQHHKFLLPLPAAIPLMVLNIGVSEMRFPIFGNVDIGLLYPLIVIPLAVFGASNATNMLAGLNGLEAGLGVVLISSLGLFSLINGSYTAAVIAFIFVSILLAFLIYNKYPSKIFPGDSLTYTIGAVAAVVAVSGNIEKFAVFCFIPWFLEFALKARNMFRAENFGILKSNGKLKNQYSKVYSLVHAVMELGNFSEKQIVWIIICFEILVCGFAFAISL
ncbi:MAG: hypothetical protein KAJ47_02715 [Candidatus Aenigmarchaeota archaeon]|nr:hypothetical protein [Candidatus Aenigmarchaeota archaeon]